MAKELTTVVNIAGNLENSLRDTIQKAQKQIDRLGDSTKKATDAYGKMQERIEEQSDALKAAQRAYANYILSGDKSSKQAREAAKQVKDLSAKLQDSQDAMVPLIGRPKHWLIRDWIRWKTPPRTPAKGLPSLKARYRILFPMGCKTLSGWRGMPLPVYMDWQIAPESSVRI